MMPSAPKRTAATIRHAPRVRRSDGRRSGATPETARSFLRKAESLFAEGELRSAERLLRRAGRWFDQAGRDARTRRLRLRYLRGLASIFSARGQYGRSAKLLEQAVALAEASRAAKKLDLAVALRDLACAYRNLGRFGEAGLLLPRALAIMKATRGPDHPDTGTLHHDLGSLEFAAGNFARGEPYVRRALRIHERALGRNHPEVAAELASLAAILDRQGRHREAEPLYLRALSILEHEFGPEHRDIATHLNNLAALYQATGRPSEAVSLYARALGMKERLLGEDHPDVARTLNNLAILHRSRGEHARAEPLARRSVTIFERALGADHPSLVTSLVTHGRILRKLGRTREANEVEGRARRLWRTLDTLSASGNIATATIDPEAACFRLLVRPSRIHRWGVFAEERIPGGRKVIEYTGERISRKEAKRRSISHPLTYLFRLDPYWFVDGAVGGSGAEYINHSCEPNLRTRFVKEHILYMSRRVIEPGEELTVDYHFDKAAGREPCSCGSPNCRGTINVR